MYSKITTKDNVAVLVLSVCHSSLLDLAFITLVQIDIHYLLQWLAQANASNLSLATATAFAIDQQYLNNLSNGEQGNSVTILFIKLKDLLLKPSNLLAEEITIVTNA